MAVVATNAHDYIFLLHAACTFPNEVQPLVFHSCPETVVLSLVPVVTVLLSKEEYFVI